jgi:hypothetical protein
MLAADPPPTLDALTTLCSSVLQWNERLNELNGQIALRQVELARLEEHRSPPTRSLKNKGSTESLRPRDGPAHAQEDNDAEGSLDGVALQSSSPPKTSRRNQKHAQRPGSGTPAKAAAQAGAFSPPPIPLTSTPKKASSFKGRPSPHTSSSSPAPGRPGPAKLQKRRTESLASGDSAAPKYRTRSMIIVYYDSAVQSAFEELVKFVSGSRNSMRKGMMAAKMAEMRRAAEREIEADGEGESDGDDDSFPQLSSAMLRTTRAGAARNGAPNTGSDPKPPEGAGIRGDLLARYTNSRGSGIQADGLRSMLNASVIKRSSDSEQDIFDTIDKALEWCQGQCEFAAHKFLREGECGTEIENIKNKLNEVRTCAQKEVDRLEVEEASALPNVQSSRQSSGEGKPRDQKPVQVRRSPVKPKWSGEDTALPDNVMEVDDEGFEDMDISQLVFKRSRDVAR